MFLNGRLLLAIHDEPHDPRTRHASRKIMNQERYRSLGSIIGLALGVGLMLALGFSGIIPGAVFGAGGCVAGAIAGEKFCEWNKKKGG